MTVMRVIGALFRAILVLAVLAAPAFLLPEVSTAAQEISIIIGGIGGLFTLFEYASSHPGLIDFRFAPPYNRFRFLTLAVMIGALAFLARASAGADPWSATFLLRIDGLVALVDVPLSPVRLAVAMLGDGLSADVRQVLTRAAALAFGVATIAFLFFVLLIWVFRWPVGRENFNLWINLPTFEPSSGRDVERRLRRDGVVNILLGIALLYLVPVLASRAGGWFDPGVLANDQPLIWGACLWAFFPVSLIMRGMALLKLGWLVQRARGY